MGLNVSNRQIAQELDLDKDDVHQMTSQLRHAIVEKRPEVQLSGGVGCKVHHALRFTSESTRNATFLSCSSTSAAIRT